MLCSDSYLGLAGANAELQGEDDEVELELIEPTPAGVFDF